MAVLHSGILSLSAQRGRCKDVTVARLQSIQGYKLPSPPSVKWNVLRESLSVDSQNIPCSTLRRMGPVIFISLVNCLDSSLVSLSQGQDMSVSGAFLEDGDNSGQAPPSILAMKNFELHCHNVEFVKRAKYH